MPERSYVTYLYGILLGLVFFLLIRSLFSVYWPESGKGYQPTIYASGGASPEGGMRKTLPIPKEVEVGWWSTSPRVERSVHLPVYDDRSQHVEYVTPVGHWDE